MIGEQDIVKRKRNKKFRGSFISLKLLIASGLFTSNWWVFKSEKVASNCDYKWTVHFQLA